MKSINNYITEKKTSGEGSIKMIETIISELKKHNDCKYDPEKNKFTGKDADLWYGAGQFLYDYLNDLTEFELQTIIDTLGLENYRMGNSEDKHSNIVCINNFMINQLRK